MEASRLGSAIYIVPFFFVLNPALILRGDVADVLVVVATALVGIVLIGSAMQGYLVGVGVMLGNAQGILGRVALGIGGLAFALPGGGTTGFTHAQLLTAAVVLAGASLLLLRLMGGAVAAGTPARHAPIGQA
jgi:TRAP-type uncharacterized transport system fused permease subunit